MDLASNQAFSVGFYEAFDVTRMKTAPGTQDRPDRRSLGVRPGRRLPAHNDDDATASAPHMTGHPRWVVRPPSSAPIARGDLERVTISTRRRWPWPC
jgi:hypothetical protein